MAEVNLDANGNINIFKLQEELQSSLEFDVKYKQTDNMKKRASKVAKSYDEFKDMVACAHLKKLSRNEIEELSTKKKGWQKSSADKASSSLILDEENKTSSLSKTKAIQGKFRKPKSVMELSRDWRRLLSNKDKISYLNKIGIKGLMKVLQNADDIEIQEDILGIVVGQEHLTANSSSSSVSTTDEDVVVLGEAPLLWLQAFANLSGFSMTKSFFNKALVDRVVAYCEQMIGEIDEGTPKYAENASLVEKFRNV